jgi:tripartite-type tricarboxylate transporter receptor subunit TctC
MGLLRCIRRRAAPVRALLLGAALLVALPWEVSAADYPVHPVRVIVPYPPGGGTDIVGRIVADALAPVLGVPVVAENRGGAATIPGSNAVAKARPEGYTLLFTVNPPAVNATLFRQLLYDTRRDFVPVGRAALHPFVLVARPGVPVAGFEGFLAYARSHAGCQLIATFKKTKTSFRKVPILVTDENQSRSTHLLGGIVVLQVTKPFT